MNVELLQCPGVVLGARDVWCEQGVSVGSVEHRTSPSISENKQKKKCNSTVFGRSRLFVGWPNWPSAATLYKGDSIWCGEKECQLAWCEASQAFFFFNAAELWVLFSCWLARIKGCFLLHSTSPACSFPQSGLPRLHFRGEATLPHYKASQSANCYF